MAPYTKTSAHLCNQNIAPSIDNTHGKKVKIRSHPPIKRKTKKCSALKYYN